ncbi:MAG TPA: bifunctional hydroxymethylpyrimidine kinase/phosphomethylpyrimidine kinase, partial [Kofleriaceae bacterium]|nr:bifunctional hydroxymethylpyrimidine kinase/phosphomethylpyrimidine kinase [Kofleriaceae bacterium]
MPYRHTGSTARPDVLACAGLDPSGGAGLIADVRVLAELGARPVGVVTALTIQNTTGVVEWHATDPEVVSHQLAFLLTDVEVKAVKVGMIGSLAIAKA